MADIGQAFSPNFLALITQKGERAADRNLQAALAEREMKLQQDSLNQRASQSNIDNQFRASQSNIDNQFRAESARAGGAAAKSQLELIKEEGRNSRADRQNALKQAIADQKAELERAAEARRLDAAAYANAFTAARTDATVGQEGRDAAAAPTELEGKKADVALTEAQTRLVLQKVADTRARLEDFKKNAGQRSTLLKHQIDNYASLIDGRADLKDFKEAAQKFAQSMATKDREERQARLKLDWAKLLSTFDLYRRSIDDRAAQSPSAAAARDLMRSMEKQFQVEAGGSPEPVGSGAPMDPRQFGNPDLEEEANPFGK